VTDLQTGAHIHLDAEGRPTGPSHTHAPGQEQEHHHGHDHHHGPDHHHEHSHEAHAHDHSHSHEHSGGTTVQVERAVLQKNDRLAEQNRGWLDGRGIRAINLMSSPGAGKTTLLERTIARVGKELAISVIEGDQETTRDAERIRATGSRVIQINTGAGCHLDASMVACALRQLDPPAGSTVIIENVGNLVCPAMFDLGEAARAVVASVTEGDNKPAKYPHMFRAADVILLNKMDLLPHVDFDVKAFEEMAHALNPAARVIQVSAKTGDGLEEWEGWLRLMAAKKV
jgi:hydrogenase nickel incorporation protein HypB